MQPGLEMERKRTADAGDLVSADYFLSHPEFSFTLINGEKIFIKYDEKLKNLFKEDITLYHLTRVALLKEHEMTTILADFQHNLMSAFISGEEFQQDETMESVLQSIEPILRKRGYVYPPEDVSLHYKSLSCTYSVDCGNGEILTDNASIPLNAFKSAKCLKEAVLNRVSWQNVLSSGEWSSLKSAYDDVDAILCNFDDGEFLFFFHESPVRVPEFARDVVVVLSFSYVHEETSSVKFSLIKCSRKMASAAVEIGSGHYIDAHSRKAVVLRRMLFTKFIDKLLCGEVIENSTRKEISRNIFFPKKNTVRNNDFAMYKSFGDDLLKAESYSNFVSNFEDLAVTAANDSRFIAVCTPSFTGKTQLAFSLSTKKATYLPLLPPKFNLFSQPIYKNYHLHVSTLRKCYDLDLAMVNSVIDENKRMTFFTLTEIVEVFARRPSYMVGFFNELINTYNEVDPREFIEKYWSFEGVAGKQISPQLNDIPDTVKQNYIAILDEFPESNEYDKRAMTTDHQNFSASVRNILRFMRIGCSVMGTSTKINNLVGKDRVSREGEKHWCDILPQIAPFPEELLSRMDLSLPFLPEVYSIMLFMENAVKILRNIPLFTESSENSSSFRAAEGSQNQIDDNLALNGGLEGMEESPYIPLITAFLKNQILSSRPGLSISILNAMSKLSKSSFESIWSYICDISYYVARHVVSRKGNLCKAGIIWSLLGDEANFCSLHDSKSQIFHDFVDQHFYYIVNPYEALLCGKFNYFQVHIEEQLEDSLSTQGTKMRSNILSIPAEATNKFLKSQAEFEFQYPSLIGLLAKNFKVKLPSFSKEFFLYTAMWSSKVKHVVSPEIVPFNIERAYQFFMNKYESIISLDGQAAERFWCAIVINASHRDKMLNLKGRTFIESILASIGGIKLNNSSTSISDLYKGSVKMPNELEEFVSPLNIPYLASSGQSLDPVLASLFSPRIGTCRRTAPNEQVDFTFDIGSPQGLLSFCGVAEMKDWARPLHCGSLVKIYSRISGFLSKNANKAVKLHFIFCIDITDSIRNFHSNHDYPLGGRSSGRKERFDYKKYFSDNEDAFASISEVPDEETRLEKLADLKHQISKDDLNDEIFKTGPSAEESLIDLSDNLRMSIYFVNKPGMNNEKTYEFGTVIEVSQPQIVAIIFALQEGRAHCGRI